MKQCTDRALLQMYTDATFYDLSCGGGTKTTTATGQPALALLPVH